MINWTDYGISIDEHAKLQIDHYFDDLGRILDNQNLSYKKPEVFSELEHHIIDYIKHNKSSDKITFKDALEIIAELGPPAEYTDFSNFPNLINSVSNQNLMDNEIPKTKITNYILCDNCKEKNEEGSLYCINCGKKLTTKVNYKKNKVEKPVNLITSKTYYLFNIASIYIFAGALISGILILSSDPLSYILLSFFVINELIIIPSVYLFTMIIKKEKISSSFGLFFSQFLKLGITYLPIPFIFPISVPSDNWIVTFYIIYLILAPIFLTLILFYSKISRITNRLILGTTGKYLALFNFLFNFIVVCFGLIFVNQNFINLNSQLTGNTILGLDTLLIIIFGFESLFLYLFNFQKVDSAPYSYQI